MALDILSSEPERTVTYIALGPLTTLAQIAQAHGDVLRSRIGRIACMGGALDVPGNTSPVAECKFSSPKETSLTTYTLLFKLISSRIRTLSVNS